MNVASLKIPLIMLIAAALGALGQLALRSASDRFALSTEGLLMNWPLYAFIATYGVAVLLNIVAYRWGGTTTTVYPWIATSYIFAALFSGMFGWKAMLGGSTIVAGVLIMVI